MTDIYLQLFSLHKEIDQDYKAVLARVKKMGYAGVEFAGKYGGMDAPALKAFLEETGLMALSVHAGSEISEEDLAFFKAIGVRYVVCPYMVFESLADIETVSAHFNELGRMCRERGLIFAYHNHMHEFKKLGDQFILDLLMERTDPELVRLELDIGWVVNAGLDPVAYIRKHAGRVNLIHAKEAGPSLEDTETECPFGKGRIAWEKVLEAAKESGLDKIIVEREFVYGGDIYSCLSDDLAALQAIV